MVKTICKEKLTKSSKKLLKYIAQTYDRAAHPHGLPLSRKQILKDTGLSLSSLKRAQNQLVSAGYLEIIHRINAWNTYILLIEPTHTDMSDLGVIAACKRPGSAGRRSTHPTKKASEILLEYLAKLYGPTPHPNGLQIPRKQIMKDTGLSLSSLKRAQNQLVNAGYLKIIRRINANNTYILLIDPTHQNMTASQKVTDPGNRPSNSGYSGNSGAGCQGPTGPGPQSHSGPHINNNNINTNRIVNNIADKRQNNRILSSIINKYRAGVSKQWVQHICGLIRMVLESPYARIKVAGRVRSMAEVKARFRRLTQGMIEGVLRRVMGLLGQITHINAYIVTCLYNAAG